MDPLRVLRDAVGAGRINRIRLEGDNVVIGDDYTFKRKMVTPYKSNMGKGALYSLDQVVVFLKQAANLGNDVSAGKYGTFMQAARAASVAAVSLVDQKDLLAYLLGEKETSEYIDLFAPAFREDAAAEPAAAPAAEPLAAKRQRADVADGEPELPAERLLRDRNTMLHCSGKSFDTVINILGTVGGGKDARKPAEKPAAANGGGGAAAPQQRQVGTIQAGKPVNAHRGGRFEPVNQSAYWKRTLGGAGLEDLGINPNATFLDPTGGDQEPAAPLPKPVAPAPAGGEGSRRREREPQRQQRPEHDHKKQRTGGHAAPGGSRHPEKGKTSGVPIIIVPSGYSEQILVNLHNVKRFLQDGVFEPWSEAMKRDERKPATVDVLRTSGRNPPVRYEVVDKPPQKRSDDWRRVVAVFVQGAKWQFKDWPFRGAEEGDLVDTFNSVDGFYVSWENMAVNETVKKWNVTHLKVAPNARHGDKSVVDRFWKKVDDTLTRRHSRLAF